MSFSCTFEMMSSNKNYPEAEIKISKQGSYVAFNCKRNVPWINRNVSDIFFNAIRGYAGVNLNPASTRNSLKESQQGKLDRKENNHRHDYETFVIGEILKRIGSKKEFHIKLAICGSGELLSEEILLFRLIHQLRGYCGTIELILVDRIYQRLIDTAQSGEFNEVVGEARYVKQFLEELSQCLPKNIALEGRFFINVEEYVSFLQSNPLANYDFLIGTNDNDNSDFLILENLSDKGKARSMIWTPAATFPEASLPNTTQNQLRLVYPSDGDRSVSIIRKEDKTAPIKTIAAISMVILLGIAYLKGPERC